jgi:cell division transport system permease protein
MLLRQFLAAPVADLASLYGASFAINGPGLRDMLVLIGTGTLLGWFGAQISVSIHLRRPANLP